MATKRKDKSRVVLKTGEVQRKDGTCLLYTSAGRIGFLADGATPLLVHQDGKIIPFEMCIRDRH